jgi:GNAT superfamily N-acetyltransferase
MTLRLLTLAELGPEHEAGIAMLRWKAFNDLIGAEWLRRRVALGFPYADYGGLYAADGNDVLAMVEVNRPKFALRAGVETIGGFAYVCTRPSVSRMGLMKKLLKEALSREEAAGIRWMFHCTGRGLVAHALYERLGFMDVGAVTEAYGFCRPESRQTLTAGYSVRQPEKKDLESLDLLHDEFAKGRFGFSSRPKGHLSRWVESGGIALSSILMMARDGVPVAYAVTKPQGERSIGGFEMVAPGPEDRVPLLQALESRADGNWLVVGCSPSNVWEPLLAERGYRVTRDTWGVCMAMPLGRELSAGEMRHELGADDPGFIFHLLDSF